MTLLDTRVQRVANALARIVHSGEGKPISLGAARDRIAYRDRDVFVRAVALAVQQETVARGDRVTLTPGRRRPTFATGNGSIELADELDKLLAS